MTFKLRSGNTTAFKMIGSSSDDPNKTIKAIQKEQRTWHELSKEEIELKQANFSKLVDAKRKSGKKKKTMSTTLKPMPK